MASNNDAITCTKTAIAHLQRVLDPATSWPERKGHLDMAGEFVKAAGSSAMKTMLASSAAAGIVLPGQSSIDEEIERREDEERRTAALREVRVDNNGVVTTPADDASPTHVHVLQPRTLDEGGTYSDCTVCGISPADDALDAPGVAVEEAPGRVVVTIGAHRVLVVRQGFEDDATFAARVGAFTAGAPQCADGHDMAQIDNPREGEQNECGRCGALFEWRDEHWQLERTVGELEKQGSAEQRETRDQVAQNMVLAALRGQEGDSIGPLTTSAIAGATGLARTVVSNALGALAASDPCVQRVKRGLWRWVAAPASEADGVDLEGTAVGVAREAAGVAAGAA